MKKLIQVQQNELSDLRKKQWEKQGKKCPILGKPIPFEKSVLDHCHISKKEIKKGKVGEDGKGLLRGVIHNQINIFLGKIENSWVRTGCHNLGVPMEIVLKNMIEFLKNLPMEQIYIHPKEQLPKELLMKAQYNRVKRYYFVMFPNRKKLPIWKPKTKMNDKWRNMIEMANIIYLEKKRMGKYNKKKK